MLKNQWSKKEIEDSEYEIHHRALSEEYSFFEAVKDGNIEAVSKNLKEEAFTNPEGMGILSKNPLTNLKYHFVVTVALVTRYCIDGGMETEQAYRLSDFYIIHMDACSTIQEISDLHHEMALDFTGKMRLLQKNAALSKPVAQCIDYIYAHISARITVEDLAVYTNLSASYLSRLFKQNLGVSISDYIREKKIEKAQNLLRFSDFTYIQIANYLSFSSQSHFIQTFQHFVGMTPKQYRSSKYKSTWKILLSQNDPQCMCFCSFQFFKWNAYTRFSFTGIDLSIQPYFCNPVIPVLFLLWILVNHSIGLSTERELCRIIATSVKLLLQNLWF